MSISVAVVGVKLGSYLPLLLLTVALLIGIPLAYRHWQEAHEDDEPARNEDLFSDLEQAYAAGKMSEAEFHRVRELLIGTKGKGEGKGKSRGKVRPNPHRDEPGPLPATGPGPESPVPDEPDTSVPPPDPLAPQG